MPRDKLTSCKTCVFSQRKKISLYFALHPVWKGNTCTKVFVWVSAREIYLLFDGRCCEFPERSMAIFNPHSTPSVSSQALHDKWMYLLCPSLGLPRSDWNKELRCRQNLFSSFRCVQDFTHFLGKAHRLDESLHVCWASGVKAAHTSHWVDTTLLCLQRLQYKTSLATMVQHLILLLHLTMWHTTVQMVCYLQGRQTMLRTNEQKMN